MADKHEKYERKWTSLIKQSTSEERNAINKKVYSIMREKNCYRVDAIKAYIDSALEWVANEKL